jgi:hypothetical protein
MAFLVEPSDEDFAGVGPYLSYPIGHNGPVNVSTTALHLRRGQKFHLALVWQYLYSSSVEFHTMEIRGNPSGATLTMEKCRRRAQAEKRHVAHGLSLHAFLSFLLLRARES